MIKIHKCSGSGKVPPGTCTLVSRVTGTKKSRWRSAPKGGFGRAHPRKGGDGPEDPLRSRRVHMAESVDQSLK